MPEFSPVPQDLLPPSAPLSAVSADDVARAKATHPLALFRAAAARVPAYKDFLQRNNVSPDAIRTAADLALVPTVDKKNYLTQYPLESLCWDGVLKDKSLTFTSTSGSTGKPFYFPRTERVDYQSSLFFELYLESISRGEKRSTLFIVSFGMGVWIGGIISYQSLRMAGARGFPVTVITPGPNKNEIFEALRQLAPKYDQVVLGGYAPFVRDILDEAPSQGIDVAALRLKLFFAAEVWSEDFREYAMTLAGTNVPEHETGGIYGTADLGTMALETPSCIALRRMALARPSLYERLFHGVSRLPTLAQFHPAIVDFDEQDGRLLLTGNNALPLVRYDIGDRGCVRTFDEAMAIAREESPEEYARLLASGVPLHPLPFVSVYERDDFSVSLYGITVYAEQVRAPLQHPSVAPFITGKFTMATRNDAAQNQFIDVHVELRLGVGESPDVAADVVDALYHGLRERSSEYRELSNALREKVRPRVTLREHGDPEHFKGGAKQKWIKK